MGPPFDERGAAIDEAIDGLAAALTDEFPALPGPRWPAGHGARAPAGRSAPAAHLGRADRRRPPCAAPPGSPTAGCRSRSATERGVLAELRRSARPSTAAARPSTSGRIAYRLRRAPRRAVSSCPAGRWPARRSRWPSTCSTFTGGRRRPGPGAVPGPLGGRAVRPDRRLRSRRGPSGARLIRFRRRGARRVAAPDRRRRPTIPRAERP